MSVLPARRRRLATRLTVAVALACTAGLVFAAPALGQTPAEAAAENAPKVVGTPCTATAKACVDVNGRKAWLIKDGKVVRGPVPISTGKKGQDTKTGNVFRVYRKDKDFKSSESRLKNGQPAPMPFAVFFQDGGIAFHAGSPAVGSSGCVHLNYGDAQAFFNTLQLGDYVQVMNGPVADKPLTDAQLAAANGSSSDVGDDNSADARGTDESGDSDDGSDDKDKKKKDKDKDKDKKKKEKEKKDKKKKDSDA